jgi:phage tail-like protein
MADNNAPDPDNFLPEGKFMIEIDGLSVGNFREADGLTVHREVVEYQEGGENSRAHKIMGPARWSNIVLRAGTILDDTLFQWIKKHIGGVEDDIERKNGAIMLLTAEGEVAMRWEFTNGWPVRYEGPKLTVHTEQISVEVIEIAHDGFELKKSG